MNRLCSLSLLLVLYGCATPPKDEAKNIFITPMHMPYLSKCQKLGEFTEDISLRGLWDGNQQLVEKHARIRDAVYERYPTADTAVYPQDELSLFGSFKGGKFHIKVYRCDDSGATIDGNPYAPL
ncbi:hypothetical protein M3893_002715 [Vibrio metschnikovii]|nr:hypothetical protein [Vibrio metschnikovii]